MSEYNFSICSNLVDYTNSLKIRDNDGNMAQGIKFTLHSGSNAALALVGLIEFIAYNFFALPFYAINWAYPHNNILINTVKAAHEGAEKAFTNLTDYKVIIPKAKNTKLMNQSKSTSTMQKIYDFVSKRPYKTVFAASMIGLSILGTYIYFNPTPKGSFTFMGSFPFTEKNLRCDLKNEKVIPFMDSWKILGLCRKTLKFTEEDIKEGIYKKLGKDTLIKFGSIEYDVNHTPGIWWKNVYNINFFQQVHYCYPIKNCQEWLKNA